MLVRTTQAVAHEVMCLQDSTLSHKTDKRCWEIQECARDLSGYLKSLVSNQVVSFNLQKSLEHHSREAPLRRVQCTITSDQCASGWELRAVVRSCRLRCLACVDNSAAQLHCCVYEMHKSATGATYVLCIFLYVRTTPMLLGSIPRSLSTPHVSSGLCSNSRHLGLNDVILTGFEKEWHADR
jgi:hypothetical protein